MLEDLQFIASGAAVADSGADTMWPLPGHNRNHAMALALLLDDDEALLLMFGAV